MVKYILIALAISIANVTSVQAFGSCPANFALGFVIAPFEKVNEFERLKKDTEFFIRNLMLDSIEYYGLSEAERLAVIEETNKIKAATKDKLVVVAFFEFEAPRVGDSVTIISRPRKGIDPKYGWIWGYAVSGKWTSEKIKGKVIYNLGSTLINNFEDQTYTKRVFPMLIEINMSRDKYMTHFRPERHAVFVVDNPILGDNYYIEDKNVSANNSYQIGIRYGKNNYLYQIIENDRFLNTRDTIEVGSIFYDTVHINKNGVDKVCAKIPITIVPYQGD